MQLNDMKILKKVQDTIAGKIINPIRYFIMFNKQIRLNISRKISNLIFSKSDETVLIMMLLNALSIYSSHTAQIKGLENSNRRNKEFLIEQEKNERKIDLALSIIPPVLLKHWLSKKLSNRTFITKSAETKFKKMIGIETGHTITSSLFRKNSSFKLSVVKGISSAIDYLYKRKDKIPKFFHNKIEELRKYNLKAKLYIADTNKSIEEYAINFDDTMSRKSIRSKREFRKDLLNGSMYDELCGQKKGLLVDAQIIYTIIATNIIMPIYKNVKTNRKYEKELIEENKSRDFVKRQKRYEFTNNHIIKHAPAFHHFKKLENKLLNIDGNTDPNNPFDKFYDYKKIIAINTGIKI